MFTKEFWKKTVERVVRVFAWTTIATITTAQTDLVHTDFKGGAINVGIATALSFLGCLVGGQVGDPNTPSFLSNSAGKHEA